MKFLHAPALFFLPGETGQIEAVAEANLFEADAKELGVAQWVYLNKQSAGRGTKTLPGSLGMYLPMPGTVGVVGVLGIRREEDSEMTPQELHLLQTFVSQIALTVERTNLSDQLAQANSKLRSL